MVSEYKGYVLDIEQFLEGPDTYVSEKSTGWKILLEESLPTRRELYILAKYSWDSNRNDEIQEIGTVNTTVNLSRDKFDSILEENNVETLTDEQWNTLKIAYNNLVTEILEDGIIEKRFEIYKNTIYCEDPEWPQSLKFHIEKIEDWYESRCKVPGQKARMEKDDSVYYIKPLKEEQKEYLAEVKNSVFKPGDGIVPYSEHCQIVGSLEFSELERYEYKTLELLHNSSLKGNEAVALVYSMFAEGMSQKEIANELDKSPSTISQQLSKASEILTRARWTSNNVTPVEMLNRRHSQN